MANKNPAVIKMNKDGQVFHQSGASMGSFSAASSQSHKNLLADAKKHSAHGRTYRWWIRYRKNSARWQLKKQLSVVSKTPLTQNHMLLLARHRPLL